MEKGLTGEPKKQVFDSQGIEILDPRNYKDQLYIKNAKGDLVAICGCKAKQKDWVCVQPAGAGTTHKGSGKCKFHGGASNGAPKKNTNAIKHGIYKTIWVDQLSSMEKDYYDNCDIDKIKEIDNQILLTNIRIRQHMENLNIWNGEIVAMMCNQSTMSKHDYIRRDKLEELMNMVEQEVTKLQLTVGKLVETKHKLEMELGSVDDQAEQNRKSFLDAAKPDSNLFDEIDNDVSYIDNLNDGSKG